MSALKLENTKIGDTLNASEDIASQRREILQSGGRKLAGTPLP